jgi:hypothetical protein
MADIDTQAPLLAALIELAEVQLSESWAEIRDQNTYALALAALGVAVIGIVAAIQGPLGHEWWVPIPGLAAASVAALVSTRYIDVPSMGPDPGDFYGKFSDLKPQAALAQLLADLLAARAAVPFTLRVQRLALLLVVGLFSLTAIYSTLLLS